MLPGSVHSAVGLTAGELRGAGESDSEVLLDLNLWPYSSPDPPRGQTRGEMWPRSMRSGQKKRGAVRRFGR